MPLVVPPVERGIGDLCEREERLAGERRRGAHGSVILHGERGGEGRGLAMTLGRDDLIASYFTLTGSSVMEPPRFSFDERVEAAAAAGFAGVGLMVTDYEAMRTAGRSAADLQAVADSHGVAVAELEFLYDWHTDGERGAEAS